MQVARFDDFDACADALRGWEIGAVQLDRGSFQGELIQARSASMLVTEAAFGRKLYQRGEPPRGLRTVVVPADAVQQIVWRNHPVSGDQLMLFPRCSELDAVTLPDFHVFTVAFSEDSVSDLSQALAGTDYQDLLAGREVLKAPPERMAAIRRALRSFVLSSADREAAAGSSGLVGHDKGPDLMEMLVELMTLETHSRPAPARRTRDLVVRRSLELIGEHDQKPLSIVDLCRATGVSRRTLEYAFRDRFGVSPKAFLLARRLDRVRAELKRPGDEPSVTLAANRWGFHHLSQFASLYTRKFGELPSETLRAAKSSRQVPVTRQSDSDPLGC